MIRTLAAFASDKRLVGKTPLLTTLLLEYANVGQLWRMWHEHSALGQNVWSWVAVNAALWLWLNFYRVITPDARIAQAATLLGILLNGAVIGTVLYFHSVSPGH